MDINLIKNDWKQLLGNEFKKEYFKNLENFLKLEYLNKKIYPKKEQVFKALNHTSFKNAKVLILGQDPYHQKNQANGLSFSVNKGMPIPPSLKNIFKELENDLNIKNYEHGDLTNWANNGVLMLNSVLTVEDSKPNSHKNIGWEKFTSKIIEMLNKKETPFVFILWGKNAISKKSLINNKKHLILTSVHPSPLSAHNGFFGNKHFSKTNDFLVKNNMTPINWKI